MKTEAIIVGADHVARLEPIDLPELTETRVLVETLISGISCGTEGDCTSGRAAYLPRHLQKAPVHWQQLLVQGL